MATAVDIIDFIDCELREGASAGTIFGTSPSISLRNDAGSNRLCAIRKTIPRGEGANELPVGVGISTATMRWQITSTVVGTVSQTLAGSSNKTYTESAGSSYNDLFPTIIAAPGGNVTVPVTEDMVDELDFSLVANVTAWIRAICTGAGDNEFSAIMFPSAAQLLWSVGANNNSTESFRPKLTITYTDRPVVTPTVAALSYVAGSGAQAVDDAIALTSDGGTTQIASATIAITDGFGNNGATDVLAMTESISGITPSWDSGTGILTLTVTAGVAAYQAALRAVTFETDAAAGDAAREITFTVTDIYGGVSVSVTRDIDIVAAGGGGGGAVSRAISQGLGIRI